MCVCVCVCVYVCMCVCVSKCSYECQINIIFEWFYFLSSLLFRKNILQNSVKVLNLFQKSKLIASLTNCFFVICARAALAFKTHTDE